MADTTVKTLALKMTADTTAVTSAIDALKPKVQEFNSINQAIAAARKEKLDITKEQIAIQDSISASLTKTSIAHLQILGLEKQHKTLLADQNHQIEAINKLLIDDNFKKFFNAQVLTQYKGKLEEISSLIDKLNSSAASQGTNIRARRLPLPDELIPLQEKDQAKYAQQRIKDEEVLATTVRKIELDSLQAALKEQSDARATSGKQLIANAVDFAEAARKQELEILKKDILERAAEVKKSAEREAEIRINSNKQILANIQEFNDAARKQELAALRRDIEERAKIASEKSTYAAQRIKDEETVSNRVRQVELQSLRNSMEEQSNIRSVSNRQRMENAILFAEETRKRELAILRRDIEERSALLTQFQQRQQASMAQRFAETGIYRPASDTGIALTRGMSQAGRAAAEASQLSQTVPQPVPRQVTDSYVSLWQHIGRVILEYRAWNLVLNNVTAALKGIPKVGIELDSVKASLESTMGSTAGMNSALKALDAEAQRTGINVGILRDNFKGFQASTSLAGVSLDSTWKMFTNLNTVISGLHLSADRANHVFLAMSQIFNKSKVQSEELVKQLGNLLPGAFASFAASMSIAPQELAKQMKAGTVYAQDTMENFIQYMATKFAPAFAASMDNLNANTGRLQTSFIHLQETIYEKTNPAMNSFVKSLTSGIDSINGFIKGTSELSGWLREGLVAAASLAAASLINIIVSFENLKKVALAARAAVALIAPEILAIGAVVDTIYEVTNAFNKAKNAAKNFGDTFAEVRKLQKELLGKDDGAAKTEAERLQILVDENKQVKQAIGLVDELKAKQKDLQSSTDPSKVEEAKSAAKAIQEAEATVGLARIEAEKQIRAEEKRQTKEALDAKLGLYKSVQDDMEYQSEKFAKTETEAVDRVLTKFKEKTDGNIKRATADIEVYKKLSAQAKTPKEELENAKQVAEEATKTLAAIEENKNRIIDDAKEKFRNKQEAANRKAHNTFVKELKDEIGALKEYSKTVAVEANNEIEVLNKKHDTNVISFQDYYERKQAIRKKDFEDEKNFYLQQAALAKQTGSKATLAQAQEKLNQLESDYQSKSKIATDEKAKDVSDFKTNLAAIHEKYQDILGIERDSNDLTSVKLDSLRKQLELEIASKENLSGATQEQLKEIAILKEAQNLRANFKIYQKELTLAEKTTNDILQRNNELKQAGQMTDLQFAMSNTKAKEKLIALSEKEIEKMKEALDAASPEARPAEQAKYDLAVQRLESLKLVANETGAIIENSLGAAFDTAFTGLINKSMTASQAFKSFTNSILADIAKIIAQEMRSQILGMILKPLMGAAWSGLTGAFSGSGTTEFAGNMSKAFGGSPVSEGYGPYRSFANANGGVYSGAGISAHSGTIVNSPTVFPFAKGVGLMGEAGPEAILPLKRNSQGKLGVSIENSGQKEGNLYNITVNVQSKQGENPEQFGQRAAAAMMRTIAKEEISNAQRPGNSLNKSRFG